MEGSDALTSASTENRHVQARSGGSAVSVGSAVHTPSAAIGDTSWGHEPGSRAQTRRGDPCMEKVLKYIHDSYLIAFVRRTAQDTSDNRPHKRSVASCSPTTGRARGHRNRALKTTKCHPKPKLGLGGAGWGDTVLSSWATESSRKFSPETRDSQIVSLYAPDVNDDGDKSFKVGGE